MSILPREFYLKNTVSVAKNLLGKRIVRKIGRREISGIITETEAYRHKDDPASHAFSKITDRNKIMFGDVGMAYVYFTYGMHYCFNVVARHPKIKAGAVLIRAIKPKLTQALEITKKYHGVDLTKHSKLFITEGIKKPEKIDSSPRIGIREATDKLWNFKIKI